MTVERVFDPIPLQQGLRHYCLRTYPLWTLVFDPIPLQQGLRHL